MIGTPASTASLLARTERNAISALRLLPLIPLSFSKRVMNWFSCFFPIKLRSVRVQAVYCVVTLLGQIRKCRRSGRGPISRCANGGLAVKGP
jgi:hypothetical protein